ncbi:MAG: hypothetical protein KJZ65_02390 [Phycisphaerales bacterium]|nr:hypothetical protein [Phycisphaerales bacterium]
MKPSRSRLVRVIMLVSVLVLAAGGSIFGYSRWQQHQETRSLLRRSTAGRNIAQAIAVFANQNRDDYPLPGHKGAPLTRPSLSIEEAIDHVVFNCSNAVEFMDPEFAPPGFDGPWWYLASDPRLNDFSAAFVLLYESPDLNTEHILIVFNEAHVKCYSREEALALINEELARSRARHPSVTWPVPLLPPAWP